MINEHIILVETYFNPFNATYDVNTKTRSSKGKIFMNWNGWNEWYNGIENAIEIASWTTLCWALRKTLPNL